MLLLYLLLFVSAQPQSKRKTWRYERRCCIISGWKEHLVHRSSTTNIEVCLMSYKCTLWNKYQSGVQITTNVIQLMQWQLILSKIPLCIPQCPSQLVTPSQRSFIVQWSGMTALQLTLEWRDPIILLMPTPSWTLVATTATSSHHHSSIWSLSQCHTTTLRIQSATRPTSQSASSLSQCIQRTGPLAPTPWPQPPTIPCHSSATPPLSLGLWPLTLVVSIAWGDTTSPPCRLSTLLSTQETSVQSDRQRQQLPRNQQAWAHLWLLPSVFPPSPVHTAPLLRPTRLPHSWHHPTQTVSPTKTALLWDTARPAPALACKLTVTQLLQILNCFLRSYHFTFCQTSAKAYLFLVCDW